MATINHKSGLRSWAIRPKRTTPTGAYNDDSAFYNTPAWKKCRTAYMNNHPLCEVSRHEKKFHSGKVLDHIIPRRFGGAPFDERNLMALTKWYHDSKTGKESRKGQPLIAWVETEHGKIPANREDIFKVLIR